MSKTTMTPPLFFITLPALFVVLVSAHHGVRVPLFRALRSPFFYVEVGIGSPPVYVKLVFDTASTTTWTQCAACNTCFPVAIPPFDPKFSSTYRRLPENHPLCRGGYGTEHSGKFCNFTMEYIDGQLIRGQLSLDTFVLGSSKHKVPDFVFGCGLDDKNVLDFLNDTHNPISGVFGIGMNDPTSILYQLSSFTELKFSYCLPLRVYEENDHQHHHHAWLHFGKEAEIKSHDGVVVQITPLLAGRWDDNTYYAKLNAISVNGLFLPIDPIVFTRGNGVGVVLDSGTPYTMFVEEAYTPIREAVVKHFLEKYGWEAMKTSGSGNFDLCYKMVHRPAIGDVEFPELKFHFEGEAVMELIRDAVFQAFGHPMNEFCLMIQSSLSDNLLGAFQMVNQRMLFDVGASKLSFVPQSC